MNYEEAIKRGGLIIMNDKKLFQEFYWLIMTKS